MCVDLDKGTIPVLCLGKQYRPQNIDKTSAGVSESDKTIQS